MENEKFYMTKFEKLESDLITTENTHIIFDKESIKYNAPSKYEVLACYNNKLMSEINFQCGAIKDTGLNGIFMEDLIAICINRLEYFQDSDFNCYENEEAKKKLEESLMWLRKRTNNRKRRNVQGKYIK